MTGVTTELWRRSAGSLAVAVAAGWAGLGLLVVQTVFVVLVPFGGLGAPVLAEAQTDSRRLAGWGRRWAGSVLGRPVVGTYRTIPGRAADQVEAVLADPQARRDVVWLAVHGLLGASLTVGTVTELWWLATWGTERHLIAVVPILVLVLAGWFGVPRAEQLLARVAADRLGPGPNALDRRVVQLTESRAATVDASAAELRRIERDLHDGAQARLAAVGINLGLAEQLLRTDPDQAAQLIAASRADARRALAELRDLVGGIHPPVLADRGLPGALEAAALLCPVPVQVTVELPERPEPPIESAVYFAAAEALTNVGRHSGATRAWLRAGWSHGVLRVVVGDDGLGGANPERGTGLRGMQRRLATFDGTVAVHSPVGGPTEIALEVPCASSSPRTTSSSVTV